MKQGLESFNIEGIDHERLIPPVFELLAHLPNILVWVKNRELRMIWVNPTVVEHLNTPREQIIGKTDMELYPTEWSAKYQKDDLRVINTGEPIYSEIELLINCYGLPEWREVTKLPIFDQNRNVIGTTGMSKPFKNEEVELPKSYLRLKQIIQYAQDNLENQITVVDLAKWAEVSEPTLNRRFRKILHTSPKEMLYQLRITTASNLLTSSVLNISEISYKCGYKSPAAFSRAFKNMHNMSPKAYRDARK